jgi:ribosome-associated heat shock protein Hsp15
MEADTQVRLDKWLWAARFFKTRALAAEAIDGGKVAVNGNRVKRSKEIRAGDEVHVRVGPYLHEVVVRSVSDRRGPAIQARTLYEETPESSAAREKLRAQLALLPAAFIPAKGRPTKKDRRALGRFKGR